MLAHFGDELGGHVGVHFGDDLRDLFGVELAENLPLGVYVETFEEDRKRVGSGFEEGCGVELVKFVGFGHYDEVVKRIAVFALGVQYVVVV